jgi:hypothetical protein
MKFHNQESSYTSDWNVACIFVPLSSFLILCALFSSLKLHTFCIVNEVFDCTYFSLTTTSVVFLMTLCFAYFYDAKFLFSYGINTLYAFI